MSGLSVEIVASLQLRNPDQQIAARTDQHREHRATIDAERDKVTTLLHGLTRVVKDLRRSIDRYVQSSRPILDDRRSSLICLGDVELVHETSPSVGEVGAPTVGAAEAVDGATAPSTATEYTEAATA